MDPRLQKQHIAVYPPLSIFLRRTLIPGASPPAAGTGLYACIFFACGKKGYRFNPLRYCKTASLPFYSFEFLQGKNS
jgi:hypothetical protein